MMKACILALGLMLFASGSLANETKNMAVEREGCRLGGCGDICADENNPPPVARCKPNPFHQCYREYGICEKQQDGACGWTKNTPLDECFVEAEKKSQTQKKKKKKL